MGFKATDYVEPLDYDFRPHFDYHGTITEPSDQDISRFLKRWYHLVSEMRRAVAIVVTEAAVAAEAEAKSKSDEQPAPVTTSDEAVAAMAEIDWSAIGDETEESAQTKAARHVLTQMCRLVEDLSHQSIRADKLEQVPMRIRGVFFGWLVGELTEQGKGKIGLPTG